MANLNTEPIQVGVKIRLATWNCGGLSFTQRELCSELGYDILALTETHDTGSLRPSKTFVTGDIAPKDDSYAGVAILMSQRIARNVLYSGCCGARIVFFRVKASPCNLFVVSVYVPHSGRQAPSASDTLAELEALLSKVHQHDCVVLLGDFNAKLARHTDKMTGRWCIHRRANPAGGRLLGLMDRLQLCALSTLHQPRRGSTNATYLSKDPRYGPSQVDYVMISCRWATSAHKCCVKWGVSCQRWGRRYDHGLVSCVWVCRAFSQRKRDKQIDYAPLMAKDGGTLREHFDARVKQHLTATHCDMAVASASLERLTKCVTMAAQ